jgi:hypothetical protein
VPMPRPGAAAIALLATLACARAARADDPASPATKVIKDHYHQFGLALQIPVGVRVVVPYDKEFCGDKGENETTNAEVCVDRQPQTFDFEASFGIKPNFEVMLEMRLGLERDFDPQASNASGHRLFQWGPGVKFYFSQAKVSKLFSTAQVVFDNTSYAGEAGTDFFIRNVNGFQLDLDQQYGVYFYVGEELAFRRWLSGAIEAGIGIQGRYP